MSGAKEPDDINSIKCTYQFHSIREKIYINYIRF